jgi:hypothetical protein
MLMTPSYASVRSISGWAANKADETTFGRASATDAGAAQKCVEHGSTLDFSPALVAQKSSPALVAQKSSEMMYIAPTHHNTAMIWEQLSLPKKAWF